jgi:hypothetical protein
MGRSCGRLVRTTIAAAIVCFGALTIVPAAQAAFGLNGLSATPASTNAGANTNVTINIGISEPSHDLKDLTIHLPPGLVGNPQATPQCTEAQLAADACPALSDVGDVSNNVTLTVLGFLPVTQTVTGNLYNVVPRVGEPARFGIVLNALPFNVPVLGPAILPAIILQSAARLRDSDFGLDTELKDLPNTATVAGMSTAIDINSVSLTLSGMAGSPPKGFIRLPTSCKTHTVGFDATAYDAQTATGQATFDTHNCDLLPFTPELSARVKRVGPINEPVELSTTISQTIEEAGLLRAQVVLPAGIGGNNETLNNKCPQASFAAGTCPAASIVGSASATSPLLAQGLSGPVALVEPAGAALPDLGIDLRGPLALKLKGTLGFTPEGRNIVIFDGLPDIPIADFTLTFAGGQGGLVVPSRDICQPPPLVFDATFLAHSAATLTTTATPTIDCSGATNPPPGGGGGAGHTKKPRATIKLGHLGSHKPSMKLKLKAGSEKLRQAKVMLPRQLRFAAGKRFDHRATVKAGGGKAAIKHTKRSLKLSAKKAAKSFTGKFARGALKPGKSLRANAKLKFKLMIRDASGKTTKLTVRAK